MVMRAWPIPSSAGRFPITAAVLVGLLVARCSGSTAPSASEPAVIVTQIDGVPAGLVVDGDEVWVTVRES